ncbi:hypothetical protein PHET_10036, partial [Paragonimus heterotremus]
RDLQTELVEKQKVRIRNAEASGDGHCYNCGRLFMAVFNTPTECHICRHEFCRMCLEKMPKSKDLICKFCRFERIIGVMMIMMAPQLQLGVGRLCVGHLEKGRLV